MELREVFNKISINAMIFESGIADKIAGYRDEGSTSGKVR
ncbi:MAG: hypothetical protein K0R50_3023 [Eubacterium sp.]|jgi:hypothetical protein|nr:hypothetical protein [Eubacterium sp.]